MTARLNIVAHDLNQDGADDDNVAVDDVLVLVARHDISDDDAEVAPKPLHVRPQLRGPVFAPPLSAFRLPDDDAGRAAPLVTNELDEVWASDTVGTGSKPSWGKASCKRS